MNRRTFLRKTFYMGANLWFGQNLLRYGTVFANSTQNISTHIVNIRKAFHRAQDDKQVYFRVVLEVSDKCEIIKEQNAKYVQITLKNCSADSFVGTFACSNQFISDYKIEQVSQQDSQIKIRLMEVLPLPEIRCSVFPPSILCNHYRIILDIGAFSKPTQIKENNLKIKETNLKFGSLETRSETNMLIIHHVGGTDRDVSAQEIHRWHLANGWAGIGYHYVIRKNGIIERGRPRDAIGAHTYGYNEASVGINLVGDFEESVPKQAQIHSAAKLVAALCHIYDLSPNQITVQGHKDLNDTLCPGKNLYDQMQLVRDRSTSYM
ncbi:hypothetical protein Ga0466249_000911 [Sporomusaceae bacterium BoRhaA]|uniref:N-acetylmuramoyl-L-alanine amidase n=1 Tax=Pelorhabdus rhamnosifermentans TaxID=2772457 RepID=UPI001FE7205D|nr:N-acetylmuramoyl-L-alanine amidase [Pelorhabdus rhamnosifermentans]MBU2699830.1 hypothetical protein [Pelorhabdus rhamnosifermentans]